MIRYTRYLFPNHTTLQSCTITNLNENFDHYPVQLQLTPNSIIIKTTSTFNTDPIFTYPIPHTNLQNLQTTFLDKQNLAISSLTRILQQ
jgi:hypothetical protein